MIIVYRLSLSVSMVILPTEESSCFNFESWSGYSCRLDQEARHRRVGEDCRSATLCVSNQS